MGKRKLYFRQEKENTCAVACLRTVLQLQFGIAVKEELLEYGGTSATDHPIAKFGTGTVELRRMLMTADRALNERRPWRLRVRAKGTVEELVLELARDRKPMLRMHEPENGVGYHFVVLLAITADRVKLFDPDAGSEDPLWMSHEEFVRWWTDADGATWYAVVNGGDGRKRKGA